LPAALTAIQIALSSGIISPLRFFSSLQNWSTLWIILSLLNELLFAMFSAEFPSRGFHS
jgi:hypothetical protein